MFFMKTKIILRLLKAGIFILATIFYGLTSGITSQIFYAIVLTMYLIELYDGEKK